MIKGLWLVGVAAAVMSVVRFCRNEIAQERVRREARHEHHDATRWEGEGGNAVEPTYRSAVSG
ncbi:MAG: hypothetical protein ABIS17_06785 [Casimicrobiaceae bacterium]